VSLWDKPDLHRLRNQVLDAGFKAGGIRGSVFRCQCPAHHGRGYNAQFKMQPTGKISYDCFSHGCDLRLLMDCMDLTSADFYPQDQNPYQPRQPQTVSDDKAFCVVAENDISQGKKLTDEQYRKYQKALLRSAGLAV